MKTRIILFALFACTVCSCSKKDSEEDIIIEVLDSRYMIEGTVVDKTEPNINAAGPTEYYFNPMGVNQAVLFPKVLGMEGHIIRNLTNPTFYSNFALVFTFDPASNKITALTNFYGQPSVNGRSAVLDPSGENKWDPVTKKFSIKFWMDQTGVAGHKTSFNETWTFIGAK